MTPKASSDRRPAGIGSLFLGVRAAIISSRSSWRWEWSCAINVFTFAAVYSAVSSNDQLSENATQILTGWGGGVIGVIGAIVGYTAGHNAAGNRRTVAEEDRLDV